MALTKEQDQTRQEIEDALDELGEFIQKISGQNPRKLRTVGEIKALNDKLKAHVEKPNPGGALLGAQPRSKAAILGSVTPKNTFELLIEVLVDIRDALGVDAVEPVRKGDPPRKRALKVTSAQIKERRKADREMGERLIRLLNQETGKRFKFVDANMSLVTARIKEYRSQGYEDVERLLSLVIKMKCQEARRGDFNEKYLRPATLFNATKCAQYTAEVPIEATS